jgi:hypothetical protein
MSIAAVQLIIFFFNLAALALLIGSIGWFTWRANRLAGNPILWGSLGAAAYLVPSLLVKTVVRYLQEDLHSTPDNFFAMLFSYHIPPMLAGILGCYLLRNVFLVRSQRNSSTDDSRAVAPDDE